MSWRQHILFAYRIILWNIEINVDSINGEILIDNPQNLTGFQFTLNDTETQIFDGEGGLCEQYGFNVMTFPDSEESNLVLGYHSSNNSIPSGSNGILTNLTFTSPNSDLCFETDYFTYSIEGTLLTWDSSEEPYEDINEDGEWTPEEPYQDTNNNGLWDDEVGCIYEDYSESDCDDTKIIIENFDALSEEYGQERTLYELYDRVDGTNDDLIKYTVNLGDCITMPVLN